MSQAGASCFGKIPSRGDFVKGNGQHQLIAVLDRWVSQAMEGLSDDPRWKLAYDHASPFDFLFLGARSRTSVLGHLRPSTDASGRRFPFIAAATIERDDALMFRCAPAALTQVFRSLADVASLAVRPEGDFVKVQSELDAIHCTADFDVALQSDPLGNFVRFHSLESLAALLPDGHPERLRRIILAIGLLMQPLLGQAHASIDKEIILPLPVDERNRNLVAGLWLYLMTAFLRRSHIELQVIIERHTTQPVMVVGFNGSSSQALISALQVKQGNSRLIQLADPEWVDDHGSLVSDYGVAKLSAYLAQPGISLEQAIQTFREVFLGE